MCMLSYIWTIGVVQACMHWGGTCLRNVSSRGSKLAGCRLACDWSCASCYKYFAGAMDSSAHPRGRSKVRSWLTRVWWSRHPCVGTFLCSLEGYLVGQDIWTFCALLCTRYKGYAKRDETQSDGVFLTVDLCCVVYKFQSNYKLYHHRPYKVNNSSSIG
jgi:hypothetical protein